MQIDKLLKDDVATLILKGEFDTFYCPDLQHEVESLIERGICHVILDLAQVSFINSTAIGAVIKVHKRCRAENGELVIFRPSKFVRDVVQKVGIDKLVPMFDTEHDANKAITKSLNQRERVSETALDSEKVLIHFADADRTQMLGAQKALIGKMLNADGKRVVFTWNGARSGFSADQTRTLFAKDGELRLKFQIKMIKKAFLEVTGKVTGTESAGDGNLRISVAITGASDGDRAALTQFAEDMAYLKSQLPG